MQFRSDMFLLGDLNGGSAIIFAKLVEAALGNPPKTYLVIVGSSTSPPAAHSGESVDQFTSM